MPDPSVASAPIVLASASPRRRELLGQLGVSFTVEVARVTEQEDPSIDPRVMVAHNAALKADWVAARHPQALVIGADTTVFIEGQALNKPRDLAEARSMLRRLSGRTHTVFTGIAARHVATGLRIDEGVATGVTFKALSAADIEAYLACVPVLDKAGAYAIQDHGEMIVAGWAGSWTNIVGLPLETMKQILTKLGHLS